MSGLSSVAVGRLVGVAPCLLVGALGAACSNDTAGPSGPKVEVQVAALSLPGATDVCYGLTVLNGDPNTSPDTVWAQSGLCSTVYGNAAGGDLTYIGTCDASVAGQNYVQLTLETVHVASGGSLAGGTLLDDQQTTVDGDADFENPCPAGSPCTLAFTCIENADVAVPFDLTIMRDAEQGFFDVAVNFEDIFCSAKLDTCYADESHITLLSGVDGGRDWTGVFGFACTAGAGDAATTLLYGRLDVVCEGVTFPIDPTGAPGNNEVTVGGATLHYAIYRGDEDLQCDGADCNKRYWNLAFDLEDLEAVGGDCGLAFAATATDGNDGFVGGLPTTVGVAYPYLDVDAQLTAAGAGICQRHAVGDDTVRTGYHGVLGGLASPPAMCWQLDAVGAAAVAGADASCTSAACEQILVCSRDGDALACSASGLEPGSKYFLNVDLTAQFYGVSERASGFASPSGDLTLAFDLGAFLRSKDLASPLTFPVFLAGQSGETIGCPVDVSY